MLWHSETQQMKIGKTRVSSCIIDIKMQEIIQANFKTFLLMPVQTNSAGGFSVPLYVDS